MDKQYGGLKWTGPDNPIDEDTDNREITINNTMFKPVYNMVNRVDSKLSLLTANSLKGFMINLNVNENDSEYKNLDKDGMFTVPVTNFILKFVIIKGTMNPDSLEPYNGISKSFESRQRFFEEAKLQQYIWTQSIIYGRPAICPSVANLSMFDTVNSKTLMQIFLNKVNSEPTTTSSEPTTSSSEPTTTSTFEYLQKNSTINDRGIGVLTMPSITQSTTLRRFLSLRDDSYFYGEKITHEIKSRAISCVFAQIARLFIDIGVIHLDLHFENIMIYLDSDKTILEPVDKIKTLLIDFGRASNIENNEKDVLSIKDKKHANETRNILYNRFDKMGCSASPYAKGECMENILDIIAKIDLTINKLQYKNGRVQMWWYYQYRNYHEYPDNEKRREFAMLFVNAFDILKDMMKPNIKSPSIDPLTIKNYEEDGSFVNFSGSVDEFLVSNPGTIDPGGNLHQMQYRVYPPPAPTEPVSVAPSNSSIESVATPSSVDANSLPQPAPDESNKRPFTEIDPSSGVDAEQMNKRVPPQGGRKNKHHKTNKRKNGKSKRNRRNKNKNTRKKRKN
jgi:hypothetical protein